MSNTHTTTQGPRLSVSTWSLHRSLGKPAFYGVEQGLQIPTETHGKGTVSLLELPARIAAFGIHTLEICHFHLPSLDKGYLTELRGALQAANVELFSLLIDDGDITHPMSSAHNLAWISSWIEVAGTLGARCARVIAGKAQPSDAAINTSVQNLRTLIAQAENRGIRLMTENWGSFLSRPEPIHAVFEQLDGKIGLCLDFGNWRGPDNHTNLASIASYAESCHAKAHFDTGYVMDRDDFLQCLDLTRKVGFKGPYTLIYAGPDADEWNGLDREREVVRPYLTHA